MTKKILQKAMSVKQEKMFFYDRFADRFDKVMNMYDTKRRIEVIFDDFLEGRRLDGIRLLDAGSGTGWFSKYAVSKGANVTSLDVGTNILRKVAEKCYSYRVVGSVCDLNLKDRSFNVVLSSEVIEHTPSPHKAVKELCRVLKPGGILVLTVPNRVWHFSAVIANAMKIRPYEGYENWVGWLELKRWLMAEGMIIEQYRGIHLFPFSLSWTTPILRFFDRFGCVLGPIMVNIAVKARKPL